MTKIGAHPTAGPVFDPACLARTVVEVLAASSEGPVALARRQAQRLARLVDSARAHSPLYRERLRGITPGVTPMTQWPVVGKPELMQRFDEWVTDPALQLDALQEFVADPAQIAQAFAGRWQVWQSSGSSGTPALFVQDARAMAVYDALETLRRPHSPRLLSWLDPLGLAERPAFIGATGGHFASLVAAQRLQQLNPWLAGRLRCFSIQQRGAELLAQLQDFAPTVIATYPSVALWLAEQVAAGRLVLHPREIWTGGETLSPAVRQQVQRQFGCPLFNSYGASEFLTLGWPCNQGSLHLNADWALLEPVDEHYRPVPPGETSQTCLLTHLAQFSQPLIRYELGDRIKVASEPCACGSRLPVIEVEGRCDDALLLTAANGVRIRLLPMALTTVLEEEAGLYDFQLRQQDARSLVLRLPPATADAEAALLRACKALRHYCAQQGLRGLKLVGETGPPWPSGPSGKHCRVIALPAQTAPD